MNAKELLESLGKRIAYLKTMDESVDVAYEIEEIQTQALSALDETCVWKWDETKQWWETSCGYYKRAFTGGSTIKENGYRGCPYCIKRIEESKP